MRCGPMDSTSALVRSKPGSSLPSGGFLPWEGASEKGLSVTTSQALIIDFKLLELRTINCYLSNASAQF